LPARTAQRSTGSATPSSWTISMPGAVPGRGRRSVKYGPPARRACRRRTARMRRLVSLTNVSSVPLSAIQSTIAANTTARIAATTRVGRLLMWLAGSSSSATMITMTWTMTPSSIAPQPPSAVTPASSSGRSTAPTAAISTTRPSVSTMSRLATPGISHSVRVSTTNVVSALRTTARSRLRIRRQLSNARSSARQSRSSGTGTGSRGLLGRTATAQTIAQLREEARAT
jgi:hypothetical protein